MSYSFLVTADTKDAAKQGVADQFDAVVSSQPTHAKDRDAVVACASAFIDVLVVGDGDQVVVNCYGSLGWRGESADGLFISAQATVTASARRKQNEQEPS